MIPKHIFVDIYFFLISNREDRQNGGKVLAKNISYSNGVC